MTRSFSFFLLVSRINGLFYLALLRSYPVPESTWFHGKGICCGFDMDYASKIFGVFRQVHEIRLSKEPECYR